ncbi:MAG: RNA methyltransferase [Candidatus Poribacteria bacterium]|nr:RNA methyltransferase [Candidatus Poribacteria bacterium]
MLIRSTSNPQIRYIRQLSQRRKVRKAHREFCVEGVQAISEAYRHGWHVKQLIYCPTLVGSNWAQKTLAESDPQTHLQVTETLLSKLSDRSDVELMAIVSQAKDDLARIPIRSDLLVIMVERPQNPGNLGTIIRSADALGAHGVLIMEPAVDLYDPKTARATMGSLFALPVLRLQNTQIFQGWIDKIRESLDRLQVVVTSPHASITIDQHDLTLPTVLIIGNEQAGISKHLEEICDALVSIPMHGSAESLNSAVSASIVLYEAIRQRLASPKKTNFHTKIDY